MTLVTIMLRPHGMQSRPAIDEIHKIVQAEQIHDFNAWSIGPNNKVNESKPTKRGQLFRRFLVRLTKCNGFRWAPQ